MRLFIISLIAGHLSLTSLASTIVMKCRSLDPTVQARVEIVKTDSTCFDIDRFKMTFSFYDNGLSIEQTVYRLELYKWFDKVEWYKFRLKKEEFGLVIRGNNEIYLIGPMCDDVNDRSTCVYGVAYAALKCEFFEDLEKLRFHTSRVGLK